MEQEIVEIPENKVGIAFHRPQIAVVGGIDLEQDLAVHQQGEQLRSRESLPRRRSRPTCCGVDSKVRAVAIFGSQIRNSAPARGDSSTIASPRRRR